MGELMVDIWDWYCQWRVLLSFTGLSLIVYFSLAFWQWDKFRNRGFSRDALYELVQETGCTVFIISFIPILQLAGLIMLCSFHYSNTLDKQYRINPAVKPYAYNGVLILPVLFLLTLFFI